MYSSLVREIGLRLFYISAALVVTSAVVRAEPAKPKVKVTVQKNTAGGPQLEYEKFRKRVELKVAKTRDKQIEGLTRLLSLEKSASPDAPNLKFRLAELYYEKSRYYFIRSQENDDAILRARSEAEKQRLKQNKISAQKQSDRWNEEALNLYADIRQNHPSYERMPEVLFALGQSYWSRGQQDEALSPYADLIRNYPKDSLVPEAWVAFGEYYFDKGNIFKALKSYDKAAQNKRSRVYGFALYKQGWCYFNLAEWQEALNKFETTVLFSQLSELLSGENKIALGREAQRDWVKAYSHIGDAKNASTRIATLLDLQQCTGRCLLLLEKLADLWLQEGFFKKASYLYAQLIDAEPKAIRNAIRQARVVELTDRTGDKKRASLESQKLVEVLLETRQLIKTVDQSKLSVAKSDLEEAELVSETSLRRLAQQWNNEGRKTRNYDTLGLARVIYEDYLRLFPNQKYAYGMRFQLADLYYKIEDYAKSAQMYKATIDAKPDGEHMAAAANDYILALELHIESSGVEPPEADSEDLSPKKLQPDYKRLVEACDLYTQKVSNDKADKLVAVKLKAARVYYDHSQFDEAIRRFEEVVSKHPKSPQAEVASNLVVDVYNLKKDWKSLLTTVRKYLSNQALLQGRPKLRQELRGFGEYASFSLVKQLEDDVKKNSGDLRLVARAYEDFYKEFPRSENADKALFNASVAWDRTGHKERAAKLRSKLLADFPKSALRVDVAYYVAKQHEERTEYLKAASTFRAFSSRYPKDQRAKDALYNASVFYAGTGKYVTAANLRKKYLELYGSKRTRSKDVATVKFAIAKDLESARRWRSAVDAYADFVKSYRVTEQGFEAWWSEINIRAKKLGQRTKSDELAKKLLGTVRWMRRSGRKVPDNAVLYASLVAFKELDEDFREYSRMRLVTPSIRNPTPFRRSLKDKARSRDRLIAKYKKIVEEYKQAESSVASLYQIARSWDIFSGSLMAVPCPRGLTAQLCSDVKKQVQELAAPAHNNAVEAYKVCVLESNKLEVFTDYSQKCLQRLGKFEPSSDLAEKTLEMKTSFGGESLASQGLIFKGQQ